MPTHPRLSGLDRLVVAIAHLHRPDTYTTRHLAKLFSTSPATISRCVAPWRSASDPLASAVAALQESLPAFEAEAEEHEAITGKGRRRGRPPRHVAVRRWVIHTVIPAWRERNAQNPTALADIRLPPRTMPAVAPAVSAEPVRRVEPVDVISSDPARGTAVLVVGDDPDGRARAQVARQMTANHRPRSSRRPERKDQRQPRPQPRPGLGPPLGWTFGRD